MFCACVTAQIILISDKKQFQGSCLWNHKFGAENFNLQLVRSGIISSF
jgi:hypothetical protein